MTLQYTSISDIGSIHATLKATFNSCLTKDLKFRKQQLLQLARMLQDNDEHIYEALHADLHKPRQEAALQELAPLIAGAIKAAQSVDDWAKPELPDVDPWKSPLVPKVLKAPKGLALIIAPWNYPVILCLQPLIGAIAAGCAAVVKPSELAPNTAQLLADLFPKYLDATAYAIVNGAVPETTAALELPWDHIFYTGNGRVGRIVAAAAARHLTPCTLELGGQSPVIVDNSVDVELAAKRIVYGKAQNSGQLCVSPNHVFVLKSIKEAFVDAAKKAYKEMWPKGSLVNEDSFGRIVNHSHFKRLEGYLNQTKGQIAIGGSKEAERGLELTLVDDVALDDSILEEELFGPILAVVPVDNVDEAIRWINSHDHPLAMYVFTTDEEVKQKVVSKTSSGSLIFNDTTSQLMVHEIPFGGTGGSGHGYQHGKYTFDTFSYLRSSIDVPEEFEAMLKFRYPPFTKAARDFAEAGVKINIPTIEENVSNK